MFFINLRLFKNRLFTTKIDALGWLSQVLMRNFGASRSLLTNPPQFLKMTLMGGSALVACDMPIPSMGVPSQRLYNRKGCKYGQFFQLDPS